MFGLGSHGTGSMVGIVTTIVFATAAGVSFRDFPVAGAILGALAAFRLVSLIKARMADREEEEEEQE